MLFVQVPYGTGTLPEEDSLMEFLKKFLRWWAEGDRSAKRRGNPSERDKRAGKESVCEQKDLNSLPQACELVSLEEFGAEKACLYLAREIEQCLSRSKKSQLQCQELLIPAGLSHRIARDILRLSSGEPCGLRGALIYILLEGENTSKLLGKLVPDCSLQPTFELTLVFKLDSGTWSNLWHLFSTAHLTLGIKRVLKLSPGFRLVKRKLYSSAGPIVEEY
ncbi:DNA damage-inducible transcript 4-like protein-like [Latimeria chalumnae]|uniref:DNA damage-inducible transcript 4-like protein-like n=1 Tax=Latimeria chalumnae TaxID=7897 RepID=UPI00313CBE07